MAVFAHKYSHLPRKASRWIFVLVAFIFALSPQTLSALNPGREEAFAEYGILFYDPDDFGVNSCYGNVAGVVVPASGGGYTRMKSVVARYGEYAMEMQRAYGAPWEVVFAQMQVESQMGTAGHAIEGATNNWLGITGEGDMGYHTSASGGKWAKYSSLEASISDWAGTRVLRDGMYDATFVYLDPANYDLRQFVITMLNIYAPPSDGNDVSAYAASVLSLIEGPIAEVRAEKGWPSSAELAAAESIEAGGLYPIGGGVMNGSGGVAKCGMLTPGGMAEASDIGNFLRNFINDTNSAYGTNYPNLPTVVTLGVALGAPGGDNPVSGGPVAGCWRATWCGQCTALSGWFVYQNTTLGESYLGGHGGEVVGNLAAIGVATGDAPQPYAVFSDPTTSVYGHTGVVFGVRSDGSIITGENNIGGRQLTVREYSVEKYRSRGMKFAYTGDYLK
jgi:surface antigen